ncbi:hypothetical protein ANN_15548 [Periplaneta americana]|uniref:Uncharacterized protein n=1 Tax=Periplaneta americana TaxID=6978 RepID=A0ABQ8SGN2_PERAM|nr:hypothetical protein ANN_15548 [Periplaneta americana]
MAGLYEGGSETPGSLKAICKMTMNVTTEFEEGAKALFFSWLDFTLFILMLVVSTLIGIYFGFWGKKEDTPKEYLHGGKTMNTMPVAVSLVSSIISGITVMGAPSEIYMYGTLYWLVCVSAVLIGFINNYIYLPVFYELQLTSTYEYLQLRFNKQVRVMASVLYTIGLLLNIPIVVYVPALAFSQVSGVNIHIITVAVSVLCIFYTMLKESGLSSGRNTIDIARRRDERRTNLYMIRTTEKYKKYKQIVRSAKLRVEQKKIEKEGTTYSAGGFYKTIGQQKIETNSKNKNIRDLYKGIKEFKNGYQPRVNVIKDENGDLLADSPSNLNRWKNYFAQLLNVHRPNRNDRDEIEIQTAEPFIPEPTLSEVEIAIENLKKYKSPGIDQIPAELIQEGGSALYSEIYKLVLAIWEKEIVPEKWKESIIVPIFKKGDKTNCGNFRGISLLLTSYKILSNILLRRLTPYVDEIIGDHQCGFRRNRSTIDQIFVFDR